MKLGEFAQAQSAVTIPKNRVAIDVERLAADVPAFEFGAAHPGADTLDDEVAFELRDRADDHDDSSAECSAGVDIFAERDELDAEATQFIEDFQIVPDRAGDTITGPDYDDVELATASVSQKLVQSRPLRLGAADFVSVLMNDLETPLLCELSQVVELRFGMLIDCGNAQVQRCALQDCFSWIAVSNWARALPAHSGSERSRARWSVSRRRCVRLVMHSSRSCG